MDDCIYRAHSICVCFFHISFIKCCTLSSRFIRITHYLFFFYFSFTLLLLIIPCCYGSIYQQYSNVKVFNSIFFFFRFIFSLIIIIIFVWVIRSASMNKVVLLNKRAESDINRGVDVFIYIDWLIWKSNRYIYK